MRRAAPAARFLAFVIDVVFLWCAAVLTTGSIITGYFLGAERVSFRDPVALGLVFGLVFFLSNLVLSLFYFTYLTSGGARTMGKEVFKIRVVRRRDEGNVGWGRAFARTCACALSAFPFFLGFLMAFFFRGRALHDILAGTKVVREE